MAQTPAYIIGAFFALFACLALAAGARWLWGVFAKTRTRKDVATADGADAAQPDATASMRSSISSAASPECVVCNTAPATGRLLPCGGRLLPLLWRAVAAAWRAAAAVSSFLS